jgi:hypothetical protein
MKKIRAANDNSIFPRYAIIISCVALMLFAGAAVSQAALDVSPISVNVVKGKNTNVTITWVLTGLTPNTWSSPQGIFETPAGTLATNAAILNIVTGVSGSGSITESLVVPAGVVDLAALGGNSGFTYRREFRLLSGALGGTDSLNIAINFPSQAAGPVSLRRVELYFEEDGKKTNEVTVGRNARGLAVLADLYVNGTGYLDGYWEVDGRRIESVREYASFGSKVTVRSSEVPGIPTFRPGLHSVRLVVTNPAPGFSLPRIGYIVTSGDAKVVLPLHLLSPENGQKVNGDTVFSWKPGADAAYILTYTSDPGGEVVLTAQTKKPDYQIPGSLLVERFTAGAAYLWQIQGFDAEGELVSESRTRRLTVRE